MQRICAGSVSTHALREEGDREPSNLRYTDTYFNPRPPRGGRPGTSMPRSSCIRFQSTFSMQRVTVQMLLLLLMFGISTHIFREENNAGKWRTEEHRENFNPRPPRGGRQVSAGGIRPSSFISIHALREEGDAPRSPPPRLGGEFQSTPSARRATGGEYRMSDRHIFQSTPSARRATSTPHPCQLRNGYFNPRPPRGGRLQQLKQ